MHYRTIAIGVSLAALLIVLLAGAMPDSWFASVSQLLVLVLIVVMALGILLASGYDQDPPPRNKWYHF
ncbi:MAG: hypothetical protein H6574_13020 [Lewinellaceae bacterium]|nr:hypothetical protein [Saprospiraceae bacterium]MCB9315540.1 hypothetical protein [Lewinellaceae bacterium]MCB9331996.1 hypothetical protein [Lewinellaceae bacterium]